MHDFVSGHIHSHPRPHVVCGLQVGHPCAPAEKLLISSMRLATLNKQVP